jgi:hypothetical protein
VRFRHPTRALREELAAVREQLTAVTARLDTLQHFTSGAHAATMEGLRYVRDDDVRARAHLWALRETPEYEAAYTDDEPLVTVIITTYRNHEMLKERSLPSVLAQTYERFEVLVVGDAAPPETEAVIRSFNDDRVSYVNLPYRGPYPERPDRAWYVSGTAPYNTGLALAKGAWIGSNSDDDALRPEYIETLLALGREQRAEVPYGQIDQQQPDGENVLLCTFPPSSGHWGTQCCLFHGALRFLPHQPTDWLFELPNDWGLCERMLRIGVRFAMTDTPVCDYYPSSLWTDRLTRDHF